MAIHARDSETAHEVNVLTAGRGQCPACEYQLAGCPIVREPHYGLLILRCPECGHVSTPVPSHLADRMLAKARRTACFWWLLFVAVILAPAAALAGLSQSTGFAVSRPYAIAIATTYRVRAEGTWSYQDPSVFCLIPGDFAATVDGAFFDRAGGWVGGLDWPALTDLLFAPLICLPAAVLWALLLPHLRRGSLLLLGGAAMALGGVGLTVYYLVPTGPGSSEYAYRLAELRCGYLIGAFSYAICAGVFVASLWAARPLTRALSNLAPAAVRVSLRLLWVRDGLEVPRDPAGPAARSA